MAASQMAAFDPSYFADFEQIKIFNTHFADFKQVRISSSHFADFEQVKKTINKITAGETGYLCIFFWPWPHVTSTPPQLLRPAMVSTSSELYPNIFVLGLCLMSPALHPSFSDL